MTSDPVTRLLGLACVGGLLVTAGCLHHPDIAACTPAPGDTECWVSSRSDAYGRLRHVVIERVTPSDRCDKIWIEQDSFDASGVLVERAVDERRCNVVDRRTIYRYDLEAGELESEVWIDDNHDDRFERFETHTVRLVDPQRAFAVHAKAADAAELHPAHAHHVVQRPTATERP